MKRPVWGETFWTCVMIVLFAAIGLISAWIEPLGIRLSVMLACALGVVGTFIYYVFHRRHRELAAAGVLEKETAFEKYINATSIPSAILEEDGRIFWQNPAFGALVGPDNDGKNVYRLLPGLEQPDRQGRLQIGQTAYRREITPVREGGRTYKLLRLVNEGKAIETVSANRAMLPVMCDIEIDNFGDLVAGLPLIEVSRLSGAIDECIAAFAAQVAGMLIKIDESRYHICFEHRYLPQVQQARFSVLDRVRAISTSRGEGPTLSIAVGSGDTPLQSGELARKAMELAMGRGGDQAVVGEPFGYSFYGGVQRAVEVKSRVRPRSVSRALRNLMEQCEDVFILGHRVPDMDCLGAALGLMACTRVLEKPTYIVLDKPNAAITELLSELKELGGYKDVLVAPSRAKLMMGPRSMLIVVDTQNPLHTMAPALLENVANLVVIDHHLKGTSSIEKTALFYHEPYASSTSEMVTELVQYFSDRAQLLPIESQALMAGIMLDTKGFAFNTGVRTFEAASYLRRAGATTTSSRRLFQDDLATFLARASVVKGAQVRRGVAVAVCPRDSKSPELLAAQSADSLIGIKGIGASFVLCETGGQVSVSGRSIGEVNVQMILEKMGGGGHATNAGAQVRGKSAQQVAGELWTLVDAYLDAEKQEK